MSRIDEALRQAARGAGAPASEEPSSEAGRLRPVEASALDRYRAEDRFPQTADAARTDSPGFAFAPRAAIGGRVSQFDTVVDGTLAATAIVPGGSEQYDGLAAALQGVQLARGIKTLMISSALPGEGKTFTATNLALTLSERSGRRVLLIDADLRAPSIHTMFRLPNATGLSNGLSSQNGPLPVVDVSSRLAVLTAGRVEADPMEVLISNRMRALLVEAASRFDWVLLDTPPVTLLSDPHLLAWLTEGVVLVIEAGKTPSEVVRRAIAELGAERLIGTVLNRVKKRSVPAVN
jgi:capsular exopolysaccharide synthesis family protein